MPAPEFLEAAIEIGRDLGISQITFRGDGSFKETYSGVNSDGGIVAMKLVDRSKCDRARTDREVEALKRCESERIARFLELHSFNFEEKTFEVVLEEYLDGGSLADVLEQRTLTQPEIRELLAGLMLAVKELRKLRLVHRDIKPPNVMFRKDRLDPVLIDFGLVRDLSQTSLTLSWMPHGPGTPVYAPPEQLNNEKHLIDWRSDQFAVGVVGSLMLTGRLPHQVNGASLNEAVLAVASRRQLPLSFVEKMGEIGMEMIPKMLAAWPIERFSDPDELINKLKG